MVYAHVVPFTIPINTQNKKVPEIVKLFHPYIQPFTASRLQVREVLTNTGSLNIVWEIWKNRKYEGKTGRSTENMKKRMNY